MGPKKADLPAADTNELTENNITNRLRNNSRVSNLYIDYVETWDLNNITIYYTFLFKRFFLNNQSIIVISGEIDNLYNLSISIDDKKHDNLNLTDVSGLMGLIVRLTS